MIMDNLKKAWNFKICKSHIKSLSKGRPHPLGIQEQIVSPENISISNIIHADKVVVRCLGIYIFLVMYLHNNLLIYVHSYVT